MEISPLEGFTMMFGVAEAIGALLLILIAVWLGSYRGGFAWQSDPKLEFNWHPLLMTVGMIFLYGNAILVYRAFRNSRKRKLKIAHTIVNAIAFVLTVIGLQAVFDSHNLASPPIPNMYSLHSWLGLGSVILFACQWLTGLITFLYPTLSAPLRAAYYPIHVFFGINAFVCAAAAALLGLTEKAIFSVSNYSEFPSEGLLINFIGVAIIVFVSLVVHLVSETKYKRQPLPEDEMLLTANDQTKKFSLENMVTWFPAQTSQTAWKCSCANQCYITTTEPPLCKLFLTSYKDREKRSKNMSGNARACCSSCTCSKAHAEKKSHKKDRAQ